MSTSKRERKTIDGSIWEPVRDVLAGVEQAAAGGWYPARRAMFARLAEAARASVAAWVPEADVEDGPRELAVSFALPGVAKGDIRLSVAEDSVTVSGRRREEEGAPPPERQETPRGEFLRRVRLPAEVKPESAKAVYRDGILRVTVARARPQSGRSVKIE